MRLLIASAGIVLVFAIGLSSTANAQTKGRADIGKREYDAKCAVCHGATGKGDGSYAELLKRPAADLTLLRKNNSGIFPVDKIYASIDGRDMVKSHGDREMPIWGRDYGAESAKAAEYYVDMPYDTETYIRSRILALIDYLNRLQSK